MREQELAQHYIPHYSHLPAGTRLQAEHTIRYRKKVEKDEDYVRTVGILGLEVW